MLKRSLLVLLFAAACTDSGSSPQVSNITAAPLSITVGMATTVSGSVNFNDRDGDLDLIAVDITAPGGAKTELPAQPIQGIGTQTMGTVNWAVIIQAPSAGAYRLGVSLIDREDNQSNILEVTLNAQ
jgi:hypothetical protein